MNWSAASITILILFAYIGLLWLTIKLTPYALETAPRRTLSLVAIVVLIAIIVGLLA